MTDRVPTLGMLGLENARIIRYEYTEQQDHSGLIERLVEFTNVGDPAIDIVETSDLFIVASLETDGHNWHTTLYLKPPKHAT